MLQVIEKLLILQDRDRRISKVEGELNALGPQKASLKAKLSEAHSGLEAAKLRVKQLETDRSKLELDVQANKQKIEKYSVQQFQTKKNDEFRALGNEIETCKAQNQKLDDQQLELMEKIEAAQKDVAAANETARAAQKVVESQIAAMDEREKSLRDLHTQLKSDYPEIESAVDESARLRYMRLRKTKPGMVLVGITHSACGGCHMRLPQQIVLSTQADQEIVACPSCSRMLYYSREMDVAVPN